MKGGQEEGFEKEDRVTSCMGGRKNGRRSKPTQTQGGLGIAKMKGK